MPAVLIIEDSPRFRRRFQREFEAAGWTVELACDGVEGIARLDASPPDVIVTDLHMPLASGEEVLEHARQYHPDTPVLVVTADRETDTHRRLRGLGAHAVLAKPAESGEVARVAAEAVQRDRFAA